MSTPSSDARASLGWLLTAVAAVCAAAVTAMWTRPSEPSLAVLSPADNKSALTVSRGEVVAAPAQTPAGPAR